jgi:formiminoglutamase
MSVWTGRVDAADGPRALRWHQMVRPLAADSPPGVVLIGFACDEGVRRNGGRVGAKEGPIAIRKSLANLAWHQPWPVYDAGDIPCDDGDLEGAQGRLAQLVTRCLEPRHRAIVMGGGHETAVGSHIGLLGALLPEATTGVINIDAHLDVRGGDHGTSGTPFSQIAEIYRHDKRRFRYFALGIAEPSNTAALFDRAGEYGAQVRFDTDLRPSKLDATLDVLTTFARNVEVVHLSVDLDVLPGSVMPAVSAPAARGVPLESVELILATLFQRVGVGVVDLVELNPALDVEGRSARVAAQLIWEIARLWPPHREE